MSLVGVVVLSFVIDALAPTFGAGKSSDRAGKVAAYAPTAGLGGRHLSRSCRSSAV